MNKKRLTIISVIGGGLLLAGLVIAKGLHAAHGHHRHSKMSLVCRGDRGAKLEKMTNLMTSKLNLNQTQLEQWGEVTTVLKNSDLQSLCNLKNSEDVIATEKLKTMESAMSQGLETLKSVQVPFNRFYTSLEPDQQNMLNNWFSHRHGR